VFEAHSRDNHVTPAGGGPLQSGGGAGGGATQRSGTPGGADDASGERARRASGGAAFPAARPRPESAAGRDRQTAGEAQRRRLRCVRVASVLTA